MKIGSSLFSRKQKILYNLHIVYCPGAPNHELELCRKRRERKRRERKRRERKRKKRK